MERKKITTIELMGTDYDVYIVSSSDPALVESNGVRSSSIIDLTNQLIYLSSELHEQARYSCFLHEIIHGFLEHGGMIAILNAANVNVEALVLSLENNMYQFVTSNDLNAIRKKIKNK